MKKLVILFLAIIMVMSLVACGGNTEKEIELTTENIGEYLFFAANVTECNIKGSSGSAMGMGYKDYSGDAKVSISVTNSSGAKFKNVELTFELYNYVDFLYIDGDKYGWEFSSGNEKNFKNADEIDRSSKNSRTLKVSLPYEGNWNDSLTMKLVQYTSGIFSIYAPKESGCNCYIKLISVSGKAVIGSAK
ncbi:MAG: hypothetical protein IJL47_06530 [Lachnospiraceae bacterium]|nr:hypothetical protein [Lachnospiraceae bacterium]